MIVATKNGKEYSDTCFVCGENRAAIQASQKSGDPIFCVTGSTIPEVGFEVDQEYDRHRFVRTLKQKQAEEEAELEYCKQMGEFAEFVEHTETAEYPRTSNKGPFAPF